MVRWLRWAVVLAAMLVATPAVAVELSDPDAAVRSGRDGLDNMWEYPWYDSRQDDVKPIQVKPPRNPAAQQTTTRANTGNGSLSGLMRGLAWAMIAALLCGLAYLLIKAYLTREARDAAVSGQAIHDARGRDIDRVEALPFQVKRPEANFLDEARLLYEQGRYNEAIVYLYSYQLVELDRHQRIRLSKGKTNRQYLWELGNQSQLRAILQQTMISFEDAFFGGHRLRREDLESCWRQLDQFHHHLAKVAA